MMMSSLLNLKEEVDYTDINDFTDDQFDDEDYHGEFDEDHFTEDHFDDEDEGDEFDDGEVEDFTQAIEAIKEKLGDITSSVNLDTDENSPESETQELKEDRSEDEILETPDEEKDDSNDSSDKITPNK